jgi:predicted ABC-type ATPase
MKRIVIIAGPNGAGKTTFARAFLPREAGILTFINADLIAAGLSPFAPEAAAIEAGKMMLERIEACAARGQSFAIETTLSGKTYTQSIPRWRKNDYVVKLFFLRLQSPELAIERVKNRVALGGHHIPDDVVRRRFDAGLKNFEELYKPLVDEWALYDNTEHSPILLAEGKNNATS